MKEKIINFLDTTEGVVTVFVTMFIISGIIAGCICSYIGAKYDHFEEVEVMATVSSVEFVESHTKRTPVIVGKITTMTSQTIPEQYLVTVSYKDIVEVFDNEELYNTVSTGDEIQVILKQTFNSDNALVETELVLPNN